MRRCDVLIAAVGLTPWSVACGVVASVPADASAIDRVASSDDATSDVVVDSAGDAYLDDADAPWPGDGESGLAVMPLDCSGSGDDWPMFGQNVCNTRSAQDGGPISPSSASRLAIKWVFNAAGDISATPAIASSDVYVPDWGGMLHRIDAPSGRSVWSRSVGALVGMDAGASQLGMDTPAAVVSRVTPVVTQDSVIIGLAGGSLLGAPSLAIMLAVDRGTGDLKWRTLLDPHPAAFITSAPVLEKGTIYVGVSSGEEPLTVIRGYPCCSFRGSVVALDATTGTILWKTYMIEDSAYFQNDGRSPSGFSGAAVWSGTPVVDRKRHSLYVTTGNNYSVPNGVRTLPPGDHIDSIMSLSMDTGAIQWTQRMTTGDQWTAAISLLGPSSSSPDWDFGSGANLFRTQIAGVVRDVVGAGQKSGRYWAVDPDTGSVLWSQQVGPGGHFGGIHWGPAVDAQRIYVGVNNETSTPYTLGGLGPKSGQQTSAGSWAALDPSTGNVEWQIANPAMTAPLNGASVNGPLAAVNGVVFAGSMDTQGTMFAFDGASGDVLWSFPSGGTVYGGAAVAGGVVYWGNGYPISRLGFGSPGGKLYAFQIGR